MKNYDLDKLNQLRRWQIEKILEANGFACYDNETIEDLREALRVNLRDGTIDRSVLWED